MVISNSHSPPKKSKLTIKIDNVNLNSNNINNMSNSKQSGSKPHTGNSNSNNIKQIKIDTSPYGQKNGQKINLNIKTFSPIAPKKDIPGGTKNIGKNNSHSQSQGHNNINNKLKTSTNTAVSNTINNTNNPPKKTEDPKQIEIYLSDDAYSKSTENGTITQSVNNENHMMIDCNDEVEES
jgi:hypothetical protein